MLEEVPSTMILEWMAFYQLEPFGTEVDMIGHAMTSATIANVNRGKGKAYEVSDFMPEFRKHVEKSPEALMQFVSVANAALGGKDLRNG